MTTITERDAALEMAHLIIASDKIGIVLLSGEDKQLVARQLLAMYEEAALYRKALQRCEVFMRHLASINGEIPAYDTVTLNEIRCEATAALAVRGEK